jgi:replicative DNA helicase
MSKLPVDLEAEGRLLGGALASINWANDVASQAHVAYFSDPQNAHIFAIIKQLVETDSEVTLDQIFDLGAKKGVSAQHIIGLNSLGTRAVPFEDLLISLKEAHFKRSVQTLGKELFEQMGQTKLTETQILELIDKSLNSINQTSGRKKTSYEIGEILDDPNVVERYSKLKADRERGASVYKGIPTGFHDLDEKINSFQNGHLTIIGARPAVGKTLYALNLIEKVSFRHAVPTLFFSLEMPALDVSDRLIFQCAEISHKDASKGIISDLQLNMLEGIYQQLKRKSHLLVIEDQDQLPIDQLKARALRYQKSHGIKLIIVDYLQRIKGSGSFEARHLEIGNVSSTLKAMAKDMNIPIVALAQLNREVTARADKRPLMSDLRESGQIEADADEILLLHRDDNDLSLMEVLVVKNRFGPTGKFALYFDRDRGNLKDYGARLERPT